MRPACLADSLERAAGPLLPLLLALVLAASASAQGPAESAGVSLRIDSPAFDRPEVARVLRGLLYAPTLEFLDLPAGSLRGMRPCFLFARDAPGPLRTPEQVASQIRRLGGEPVAIPHSERFEASERGLCDLVRVGFPDEAPSTRPLPEGDRPAPAIRPLPRPAEPLQPRPAPEAWPRPERPGEPVGEAPRVSFDGYRDGQTVEIGDAPRRFLLRVQADATLTAVEVAYPGGGFALGPQELLRQTRCERFFAVPALPPGEDGFLVVEAADSRGRVGRMRIRLVRAPTPPSMSVRRPDGRPYRSGAEVVTDAAVFPLAYEAEAEAGLAEIRFESGSWQSRNRFPAGLEMQRTDGRIDIPSPAPGERFVVAAVAVDRRGREAAIGLVLVRPAPATVRQPQEPPPEEAPPDERLPSRVPPLPRPRPERPATPPTATPPTARRPELPNRPPRIETEDVIEARTWLAGGDGSASLDGAAFDDDGRVVRVQIESGRETWVAGARFSRSFPLPACSERHVTITAWDDDGLSSSRTVRLRSGHWMGDWVCRAGLPPAAVAWAMVLAAGLLALPLLRRLLPRRRSRAPVAARWRAVPDRVGTGGLAPGPALSVSWRIGAGPPSNSRIVPGAVGSDR